MPFCAGLEAAPFVFHFVFDALVEPKGLLSVPAEGELLGLPNTVEELVEVADLPGNMLVEGVPKGLDVLKLEGGAEMLFVFDCTGANGFEAGAEGAPKTLSEGLSEEFEVAAPKLNAEGVPNTVTGG
jgi:hypothetical protein